jgi:Family of unknown function (DUF5995)
MTRISRLVVLALVLSLAAIGTATRLDAKTQSQKNARTRHWAAILATLKDPLDPRARNICTAGTSQCVDAVTAEMAARVNQLAPTCSHEAAFAFSYQRLTEGLHKQINAGAIGADPTYLNHFDAIFASLYFDAVDAWTSGTHTSTVPQAWELAFDAADNRRVSFIGDVLLAMNAHITRDLPFVIEKVGVKNADGTDAKPEFDAVNNVFNGVKDAMLAEGARRFDPSLAAFSLPTLGIDNASFFLVIATWREEAWRDGQRLLAASTRAEHARAATEIETLAASRALAITAATSYVPFITSTTDRDTYCRTHHGNP